MQTKWHEGAQKNSFRRFFGSLNTVRELHVIKQDFKYFRKLFRLEKAHYIRYVDHFILAIVGDKKCAYDALVFIAVILGSLGMALSAEKSGVKSSLKGVVFLGYHVKGQCSFDVK